MGVYAQPTGPQGKNLLQKLQDIKLGGSNKSAKMKKRDLIYVLRNVSISGRQMSGPTSVLKRSAPPWYQNTGGTKS